MIKTLLILITLLLSHLVHADIYQTNIKYFTKESSTQTIIYFFKASYKGKNKFKAEDNKYIAELNDYLTSDIKKNVNIIKNCSVKENCENIIDVNDFKIILNPFIDQNGFDKLKIELKKRVFTKNDLSDIIIDENTVIKIVDIKDEDKIIMFDNKDKKIEVIIKKIKE